MKKRFQKLLATLSLAYPSGSSPYWRALPLGKMKTLLAGAFLLASAAGLAANLAQVNSLDAGSLGRGFFWPLFAGTVATSFLVAKIKKIRLVPLFLVFCGIVWLVNWTSLGSTPVPSLEVLKRGVVFDAIGVMFDVGIGSRLLLYFVTTDGLANVRMQTEFSLAHGIQAALVPAISIRTARGKSIPAPRWAAT